MEGHESSVFVCVCVSDLKNFVEVGDPSCLSIVVVVGVTPITD